MIYAYDVYKLYTALKLHFNNDKYVYWKYNGKTKCQDETAFYARKDKFLFYRVGTNFTSLDELKLALVSNFIRNKKFYVANYDKDSYYETKAVIGNLFNVFEKDLNKYINLQDALNIPHAGLPQLINDYVSGDIHLETLVVLNRFLGLCGKYDEKLGQNPVWTDLSFLVTRYGGFVQIDGIERYDKYLENHLNHSNHN